MAENIRFAEYVTSGAFTLAMTRNQVSSLSLLCGGCPEYATHLMAALERKGLAERVPNPSADNLDKVEWRLTYAGHLALGLCAEAGLTNRPPETLRTELAELRTEVAARRAEAAEARQTARSALARLEAAELELANERAMAARGKLQVRILRRDPIPEISAADLKQRAQEPV